ncbi:MAG: hypothetical protein F6K09_28625 [Merismopedia sp. SIO2A8]|nr:hypothetical protein [Symploca sp. SIO2B6]NET52507.1 hypothetical protein [Merismopedia sp. SIO2A8]
MINNNMGVEEQKQQQTDNLCVAANNEIESTTHLWEEVSEEEASKLVGAQNRSHRRNPTNGRSARPRGNAYRWFDERGGIGHNRTSRMQFDRRGNPTIILSPTTELNFD